MAPEGDAMAAETPAASEAPSVDSGYDEVGNDEETSVQGALERLAERGDQLTDGDRGTLTAESLEAVLGTCEALTIGPQQCRAQIASRRQPFQVLSEAVAREASLLLSQCGESADLIDCSSRVEDERYIRAQEIGEANADMLKMRQWEEKVWSVTIRRTDARVTPGSRTVADPNAKSEPGKPAPSFERGIPFSPVTCFELVDDQTAFQIDEPRDCPEYQRGSTPYIAKWRVKPLKEGHWPLSVKAVYIRDGRTIRSDLVPTSPFVIEVEHWSIWWRDELGRWKALALAIGGLMTAIAGWGLWKWISGKRPAEPPAS